MVWEDSSDLLVLMSRVDRYSPVEDELSEEVWKQGADAGWVAD